ncbi:39S ribosomal protein L47, mitochondrial-like isoform X2 [Anneissia japonica]|nr:39S ribosomal protein L47, mitochondrial-like isoform X2 [Anneissia japonica]
MFFEEEDKRGERVIKHGRAWYAEELRQKDNVDLHKLWYVLLIERNLLLTLEEESDRLEKHMPSPERLEKVEESMKNLEEVLKERDTAVKLLDTGYEKGVPGRWINSPLGYKRYSPAKEYYVPFHVNKRMARKRHYYEPWTQTYRKIFLEQVVREKKKAFTRERHRIRKLKKRFPDAEID